MSRRFRPGAAAAVNSPPAKSDCKNRLIRQGQRHLPPHLQHNPPILPPIRRNRPIPHGLPTDRTRADTDLRRTAAPHMQGQNTDGTRISSHAMRIPLSLVASPGAPCLFPFIWISPCVVFFVNPAQLGTRLRSASSFPHGSRTPARGGYPAAQGNRSDKKPPGKARRQRKPPPARSRKD